MHEADGASTGVPIYVSPVQLTERALTGQHAVLMPAMLARQGRQHMSMPRHVMQAVTASRPIDQQKLGAGAP